MNELRSCRYGLSVSKKPALVQRDYHDKIGAHAVVTKMGPAVRPSWVFRRE